MKSIITAKATINNTSTIKYAIHTSDIQTAVKRIVSDVAAGMKWTHMIKGKAGVEHQAI